MISLTNHDFQWGRTVRPWSNLPRWMIGLVGSDGQLAGIQGATEILFSTTGPWKPWPIEIVGIFPLFGIFPLKPKGTRGIFLHLCGIFLHLWLGFSMAMLTKGYRWQTKHGKTHQNTMFFYSSHSWPWSNSPFLDMFFFRGWQLNAI